MSLSFRLFLFAPDGLKRISHRLMEGLSSGDVAMPQYAGTKLRMASIIVSLEGSKISRIVRVDGSYLHFDKAGRVNESLAQAAYEALESFDLSERLERRKKAKVVSLMPKLRRQRFEQEYRWEPSEQDIELISQMLFRGR